MTMQSSQPPADSDVFDTPQPAGARHRRRLVFWIGAVTFALYLALSGIPGVLIQVQIQALDEANKELALGFVTSLGAIVGIFLNPMWGAVSDRTRTRWGKRAPVIVVGAIVVCLGIVRLSTADSVAALALGVIVLETGFAGMQSAVVAVVPDRIAAAARGVAMAVLGFGIMIGGVVGQIVGSQLAGINVPVAYSVGAALMLIIVVGFLTLNPEKSNVDAPKRPFRIGEFLSSFWISPRKHPDFAWAFWSRVAALLGSSMVTTFFVYILQDHIGLTESEALGAVPIVAVAMAATASVSILVSGWWSDRIGRRKIFVSVSAMITAVATTMPLIMPSMTGMVAFALIAGVGYGAFLAVGNAVATLVLPNPENAGKDVGVTFIASGAGLAAGPLVASTVVTIFDSYDPLFVVSALLCVAGGLLVWPVKAVR